MLIAGPAAGPLEMLSYTEYGTSLLSFSFGLLENGMLARRLIVIVFPEIHSCERTIRLSMLLLQP